MEHDNPITCLRAPAVAAAFDAGREILAVYGTDFDVDYKADKSPLTEADLRANAVITEALQAEWPDIPILSEESSHAPFSERQHWEECWLVDPLDGTKEFVKRNGEFTVNIALVRRGRPVWGVVYSPVLRRVYVGAEGVGAFKAEEGVHYHSRAELLAALAAPGRALVRLPEGREPAAGERPLRVVASRSHRNDATEAFFAELKSRFGSTDLVSIGSSLKLCLVAEGSADVYPRIAPTMEWDTAAAHALVNAAGGVVLEYGTDTPLTYNKPDLHNPFFVVEAAAFLEMTGKSDGNV